MAKKKHFDNSHIRLLAGAGIILALGLLFNAVGKSSALKANKELNKANCDNMSEDPLINVTERVITVDSGQAGNYWAYDTTNRQIRVYQVAEDTFCAIVQNEGKFDSQAGETSPGKTGPLAGNEDGTFKGGYRARIVGALREDPGWPMKGNVGTHDYKCDLKGNCDDYVSWIEQYFSPNPKFTYEWWGWDYKYKNHTWTNSSDGNSGDII